LSFTAAYGLFRNLFSESENVMNPMTDRTAWRHLIAVGKPFWVSEQRYKASLMLLSVLVLLFVSSAVNVYLGKVAGEMMTALQKQEAHEFSRMMTCFALVIVLATPITVYYQFLRTKLALVWREWLSNHLFGRFFTGHTYYKLNSDSRIDNPDQRMTQDVETFCNSSVGLFVSVLDAVVNIATFIGVLWSISPTLSFTVIAYSLLGSAVSLWIGNKLVALNFASSALEANLRRSLTDVRRDAESIALYKGEDREQRASQGALRRTMANLYEMAYVNRNLGFFTTPFNLLVPLIPAAIIASLYFGNKIDFGDITRAGMAFGTIFSGMTLLVQQFTGISSYAANINRVGSFVEVLNEYDVKTADVSKTIEIVTASRLALDDVTVLTPDATRTLVENLTLELPQGSSLLIMGPSGCGKSTLLRAIAGISRAGSGRVYRPALADLMFLPQRAYVPECTLREALCYPGTNLCGNDAQLLALLKLVRLANVAPEVGGLDVSRNWREMLSPGQQQLLSLARVILSKPKYAFLDEATSALDPENERLLYTVLNSVGATVVSVGHRPALVEHHTHVLELLGNGSWKIYSASEYRSNQETRP
jgi:vitamin B12/bleomycin/antimicrobial peptide transport system ATP-binding/permease protein